MTINDIEAVVDLPTMVTPTAPATFDIYKTGTGKACSTGVKITATSLDANAAAGKVQIAKLSTVAGALSMIATDRLCLVTKGGGWALPGATYVQVTAK